MDIVDEVTLLAEPRKLDLRLNPDKTGLNEDDVDHLNTTLEDIVKAFNGGISFGTVTNGRRAGHHDAQYRVIVSPAVANTDFYVTHGLARIPRGYLVVGQDKAGSVYESNRESWTKQSMALKTSIASMTIRLLVF